MKGRGGVTARPIENIPRIGVCCTATSISKRCTLHTRYLHHPSAALARFVSWGTVSTHSTHNKADTGQKCLLALRRAERWPSTLTCRQILAQPASTALSLNPHRFRTAALPVPIDCGLRTPGLRKCADSARDLPLIRQVLPISPAKHRYRPPEAVALPQPGPYIICPRYTLPTLALHATTALTRRSTLL